MDIREVVSEEVHKLAERLADENRTLREQVEDKGAAIDAMYRDAWAMINQRQEALDAAQDEIEARIAVSESLRAAFDLAHAEVLKHHTRVDAPEPWCRQCSAPPVFAEWPCAPVRAIEVALGGGS